MIPLILTILLVLRLVYPCCGYVSSLPRYLPTLSSSRPHLLQHGQLHYIDLEYPTGLSLVPSSSIIQSAAKYGIQLSNRSNSYLCILNHDGVAIRPQYQQVHLEGSVLSPLHCQEIIAKAEGYAQQHGGWTRNRHTGYPTTDLPIGDLSTLN